MECIYVYTELMWHIHHRAGPIMATKMTKQHYHKKMRKEHDFDLLHHECLSEERITHGSETGLTTQQAYS